MVLRVARLAISQDDDIRTRVETAATNVATSVATDVATKTAVDQLKQLSRRESLGFLGQSGPQCAKCDQHVKELKAIVDNSMKTMNEHVKSSIAEARKQISKDMGKIEGSKVLRKDLWGHLRELQKTVKNVCVSLQCVFDFPFDACTPSTDTSDTIGDVFSQNISY